MNLIGQFFSGRFDGLFHCCRTSASVGIEIDHTDICFASIIAYNLSHAFSNSII